MGTKKHPVSGGRCHPSLDKEGSRMRIVHIVPSFHIVRIIPTFHIIPIFHIIRIVPSFQITV